MSATERVLEVLTGCERHNHKAAGLRIELETWRDIVNEMKIPKDTCFSLGDCGHEECQRYRKLITASAGDEPGVLFGVPVTLFAHDSDIQVYHS